MLTANAEVSVNPATGAIGGIAAAEHCEMRGKRDDAL